MSYLLNMPHDLNNAVRAEAHKSGQTISSIICTILAERLGVKLEPMCTTKELLEARKRNRAIQHEQREQDKAIRRKQREQDKAIRRKQREQDKATKHLLKLKEKWDANRLVQLTLNTTHLQALRENAQFDSQVRNAKPKEPDKTAQFLSQLAGAVHEDSST